MDGSGMIAKEDGRKLNGRHPNTLIGLMFGRTHRWVGKLPIPKHAHPLVRQLFEIMNRERVTISGVSNLSGLASASISQWRYARNPTIVNFEAALNALGYELRIVHRIERGE